MQAENSIDIALSHRALELGASGAGLVSPNPLVGCVIVSAGGEIVGEGTYLYDGLIHAEAIALSEASDRAFGGTAYISLEPHSHHGKTPPCTEALINAGIRRVVCPINDPNPLVAGRGFERLRSAGIEVVTGILSEEAEKQNEKFISWHQKGRPFVHLKLAMSIDGRISLNRSVSTALSGEAARNYVQTLRHQYDAILVGANTVAVDDPLLTDRSGKSRRRPLVRIILDNQLRISQSTSLVRTARETPTIVFTRSRDEDLISRLRQSGVEVIVSSDGGRNLSKVLAELKVREIQSILVEGGSEIAGSFFDARLVDKVSFLIAPIVIGGREAPSAISGSGVDTILGATGVNDLTVRQHGSDIELTGYPVFKPHGLQ